MDTDVKATIVIAVILTLVLILLYRKESCERTQEDFTVKHRAYHSCSKPDDCAEKISSIDQDSLLKINPFVWPYSGSMSPGTKIKIQSEPDHEPLS